MSVKISLSPKEAAALFLAARAGAKSTRLTSHEQSNAANALERVGRRLDIHRVDLAWANEEPAFQRRHKEVEA